MMKHAHLYRFIIVILTTTIFVARRTWKIAETITLCCRR